MKHALQSILLLLTVIFSGSACQISFAQTEVNGKPLYKVPGFPVEQRVHDLVSVQRTNENGFTAMARLHVQANGKQKDRSVK